VSVKPAPTTAPAASGTEDDVAIDLRGMGTQGVGERSYHRLAASIIRLIEDGELKLGDRLPSERTLSQRFDVSRTAVREAIIALELRGIVEVRGGSGIYVCGTTPSQFLGDDSPGPFELLGARLVLEPELAAIAAIRAKDIDLDRISSALRELRDTMQDKLANEAADRKFHVTIAECAGNFVLVKILTSIWDKAHGVMWLKLEEHFHTLAFREVAMEDHQHVFRALVARDPDAARTAMRVHIERVMRQFARSWE
jgi:DNA-binding FadR family transcriptional regulator